MRDRSKQKYFALWAEHRIDPHDQHELDARSWHIDRGHTGKFYVLGNDLVNGRNVTRYLHRVIMDAPPGVEVDHINGDGLDNRRCNLRLCTRAENGRNLKPRGGSSKYKGVDWHKRARKWRVLIMVEGKRIYLGLFDNEVEAARAYDRAARDLHGEFARLNFPGPGEQSCLA